MMKVYNSLLNGEEGTKKPKWIGINNILSYLSNINMIMNEIIDTNNINLTSLQTQMDNFEDTIDTAYIKIRDLSVTNPDYNANSNSDKLTGIFFNAIRYYGDKTTPLTNLYSLYSEYKKRVIYGYNIILNIKEGLSSINKEKMTTEFTELIDVFANLKKMFENINDTHLNNYNEYQRKFNKFISLIVSMQIIIIAYSLIAVIVLVKYVLYKKTNVFQMVLLFMWSILFIFAMVNIFIGVALGIISSLSRDLVGTIQYSFTNKNLNNKTAIFFDKTSSQGKSILDLCANDNGNVIKAFNLLESSSQFWQINSLYETVYSLFSFKTELASVNTTLTITKDLAGLYNRYKENIQEAIGDDYFEPTRKLNNFTNPDIGGNSKTEYHDYWIISKVDECLGGYPYYTGNLYNNDKNKKCLCFPDWKNKIDSIRNRYRPIDGYGELLAINITNAISRISKTYEDMKNLMDNYFLKYNTQMENILILIDKELAIVIEKQIAITEDFYNLIYPLVDDKKVLSITSCSKNNIYNVHRIFKELP